MKILIAGGTAPFAGWLAAQLLRDGHTVRVTAASPPAAPLPPGAEFVHCGLGHDEEYALGEAVWFGVEQIVLLTNCTAFAGAAPQGDAWLDLATRGAYNLLCAACGRERRDRAGS